jgi:hypothetical protein
MLVWILFMNKRRKLGLHAQALGSTHKHLERYLAVVLEPMPAAQRRYLILVARRLPAAVVCHRYLVVVPSRLPAVSLDVHRRYLFVVPKPMPSAPRDCHSRIRTLGR